MTHQARVFASSAWATSYKRHIYACTPVVLLAKTHRLPHDDLLQGERAANVYVIRSSFIVPAKRCETGVPGRSHQRTSVWIADCLSTPDKAQSFWLSGAVPR